MTIGVRRSLPPRIRSLAHEIITALSLAPSLPLSPCLFPHFALPPFRDPRGAISTDPACGLAQLILLPSSTLPPPPLPPHHSQPQRSTATRRLRPTRRRATSCAQSSTMVRLPSRLPLAPRPPRPYPATLPLHPHRTTHTYHRHVSSFSSLFSLSSSLPPVPAPSPIRSARQKDDRRRDPP